MAGSVLRVTLMTLLSAASSAQLFGGKSTAAFSDWAPLLDFYDENDRELVAADLPVRACNRQHPSFWRMPFVRSRLRLTPDHKPAPGFWKSTSLQLPVSLPRRDFCKWLAAGIGEEPLGLLCPDCSREPCMKAASFVPGSSDMAFDLPPQLEACVWLEQLPAGASKVRVAWEQHVDPWFFVRLLLGAALISFHASLRESTALHASLGGIGSLAVLLSMAAWTFAQSTRKTIQGTVPLGGLLTSSTMLLLFFSPWSRQAFLSALYGSDISQYTILKAWLEWHDPVMNLPIGLIAVIVSILVALITVTLGARWSMRFFASAPEPEGEVAFTIGSDGRRIDILPAAPLPQRCLGWAIWQLGLALLLSSTYLDSCSLVLTVLILCRDAILRAASRPFDAMLHHDFEPANLRNLISPNAYDEQGKHHTARALAELRQYLNTHTTVMDQFAEVREETEKKMRRFSDGWGHFHHPVDATDNSETSTRWCSIL